jgi:hypothetical protein
MEPLMKGDGDNMMKRMSTVLVMSLIAMGLLGAAPASAATWTVGPGGTITIAGGPLTVHGANGTVLLRCQFWATGGSFVAGTGLPGTAVGTIAPGSFQYGNCSGQIMISIGYNWTIDATSYRSDWNWTFGNVNVRISTFSPLCPTGIRPTTPFIYYNSTGELWSQVVGPVTDATDCFVTLGRSVINPRQTMTSP